MKLKIILKRTTSLVAALALVGTFAVSGQVQAKSDSKDTKKIEQSEEKKEVKKEEKKEEKKVDKKEDKKEKNKVDAVTKADEKHKKDNKEDLDPVEKAQKESEENGVDRIYPVYIKHDGVSSLDYLDEETLNKLYKIIADNQDETFLTADEEDVIIFDSNNMYKLNKKIVSEIEKVLNSDNAPNLTKSLNYSKVHGKDISNNNAVSVVQVVLICMVVSALITTAVFGRVNKH